MGDLGTHPMAIMPSTFLFDEYCHLRNDILKPNGPIDRPAAAARRACGCGPTIEWMLAGLPWMCAPQLAFVDRPITLVLDGHRRRHVDDRARRRRRPRASSARARHRRRRDRHVERGHDFVIWGTQRRAVGALVKIDRRRRLRGRVLDGIKII